MSFPLWAFLWLVNFIRGNSWVSKCMCLTTYVYLILLLVSVFRILEESILQMLVAIFYIDLTTQVIELYSAQILLLYSLHFLSFTWVSLLNFPTMVMEFFPLCLYFSVLSFCTFYVLFNLRDNFSNFYTLGQIEILITMWAFISGGASCLNVYLTRY